MSLRRQNGAGKIAGNGLALTLSLDEFTSTTVWKSQPEMPTHSLWANARVSKYCIELDAGLQHVGRSPAVDAIPPEPKRFDLFERREACAATIPAAAVMAGLIDMHRDRIAAGAEEVRLGVAQLAEGCPSGPSILSFSLIPFCSQLISFRH